MRDAPEKPEERGAEQKEPAKKYPSESAVECLSARRKELNMTYAALAKKCDMSESTITKVLRGDVPNPTYDTIAPIADALDISLDTLKVKTESGKPESFPPASAPQICGNSDDRFLTMLIESYNRQLRSKDRWLLGSLGVNVVLVGILAFLVLYDITHPDMGWIQYAQNFANTASSFLSDLFNV